MSECRAILEKDDARVDPSARLGKTDTAMGLSQYEHSRRAGVVAAACTQGKRAQHGKPHGVVGDDQPDAGDGQAGHLGATDRPVVPMKLGNSGGGKGPWFKTDATSGKGQEIGQPINSDYRSETADGVTRESEVASWVSLLCAV